MGIKNENTSAPPSYQNHPHYPSTSYHDNQPPPSYNRNATGYHKNTILPGYNEAILSPDHTDINVYQPPPLDGAVSNVQPVVRQPITVMVPNQCGSGLRDGLKSCCKFLLIYCVALFFIAVFFVVTILVI